VSGRIAQSEPELEAIVRAMRVIAVVGIKDASRPGEPAFTNPAMLDRMGYTLIGVNPVIREALGRATLASVAELPEGVDVLDVFRRIDAIPALTDEVLALPEPRRPRVVWLQSGIRHDPSAERLAAAGMIVVQDRCLGVEASRYR
jgi:predicted CoA-binding protein